jgi:1-acyl-sn-glycerol-3-phosphate acyltransferase
MRRAALGLFTYAEFAACVGIWLPLLAAARWTHRHDPTPRARGRVLRRFGRTTSALTPLWSFRIEGPVPEGIATRPYVVVANHASTADPFLLSWLPWDMQWVAKQELFDMPVLGWLMRLGGDIPVRRGSGESVRAMLARCRTALEGGLSVMIFPEGTRSRDGHVQPFKDTAFELAIAAGVPIVPVAVAGTHRCRPKGSFWFGRARAVARVLPSIPTDGLGPEGVAKVRDEAQAGIAAAVDELERTLEAAHGRPAIAAPSQLVLARR